ncbi:MAG: putative dsRNA-binding protein, partial [Mariniphaga sp.]|nr:putative dsRNA-binding protein [Mariniphaga sp.]
NKKEILFETTEEPVSDKQKQPRFISKVILDGRGLGSGSGTSKKEAQQNAARESLKKLDT